MSDECELFASRLSDCLSDSAAEETFAGLEDHLKDCKKCQELSVKMFRTDRILSEMVAESSATQMSERLHQSLKQNKQISGEPDNEQGNITVISSARKQNSNIRMKVFLSVAACVVVGMLALVINTMYDHTELAVVVSAAPGVTIESSYGESYPAKPGVVLYAGDRVKTPKQGGTILQYTAGQVREASKLKLESDTDIKLWEEKNSKRLSLTRGTLVCNLDKQEKGREMILFTPRGEATVLGTRFRMRSTDKNDELMVAHGLVKFSSLKSPSKYVTVSQFKRAIIRAEQAPELIPHTVIGFNAEDGSSDTVVVSAELGKHFQPPKMNASALGGKYIASKVKQSGEVPKALAGISSYQVNFPAAGTYDLYQRVVLTKNEKLRGAIFYGKGFGDKAIGNLRQWVYADMAQVTSKQTFWVNLSKQENGSVFNVPEGSLTQILQFASGDPGLKIDALAFGKTTESYGDNQLDEAVGNTQDTFAVVESVGIEGSSNENLIAWWKLDETKGVAVSDSSKNSNKGVLKGSMTFPNNGVNEKKGRALNFDGIDDYIDYGDAAQLRNLVDRTDFSIFLWMKMEKHNSRSDSNGWRQRIASKRANADGWLFCVADNKELAFVTVNSNTDDASFKSHKNAVPLNEWVHVGFVYSKGTQRAKLYINGQETAYTKQLAGVDSKHEDAGGKLVIGKSFNSNTKQFFNGLMDDFRIYNKALSELEVKSLYKDNSHE